MYWNIFYHSGFLRNLSLPRKQSLPWIFQAGRAAAPPPSPASYATVYVICHWADIEFRLSCFLFVFNYVNRLFSSSSCKLKKKQACLRHLQVHVYTTFNAIALWRWTKLNLNEKVVITAYNKVSRSLYRYSNLLKSLHFEIWFRKHFQEVKWRRPRLRLISYADTNVCMPLKPLSEAKTNYLVHFKNLTLISVVV